MGWQRPAIRTISLLICASLTASCGGSGWPKPDPHTNPDLGPAAGNPDGHSDIPAAAQLEDVSNPTTVVGNGTPESCTSDAFVNAVAKGGVITFNCGPNAIIITLNRTAKVFNDTGPKVVIDGGGKVTLSGGGAIRILYQNACDPNQVWTTDHCQNQPDPQLTVQNLTFIDGNATGQNDNDDGGGGGAIFVRGGQFKIISCRFFNNVCDPSGPDVGGGAVRATGMANGPVYVARSTFGGTAAGLGNVCSNGGGLSGLAASYTVLNSLFLNNQAIGNGANPARSKTSGGGSGGAIYQDGNTITLTVSGTRIENNTANEGGGAIFFVSNDGTGSLAIENSVLKHNPSAGFETDGYPGIFVKPTDALHVTDSTLE